MKPFSLQGYIENPSQKVVTRSGRSVRILCTDAKGDCQVFGLALGVDGCEFPIMCSAIGESEFEEDDLFFDTVKKEGWVNLYKDEDGLIAGYVFVKKEQAEVYHREEPRPNYVTTAKITWEE